MARRAQTQLDVSRLPRQIAKGDREAFGFDAKEPLLSATADIKRWPDGADHDAAVFSVSVLGNVATVTVDATTLDVGSQYELSVTLVTTAGAGGRRTRTLMLEVVAAGAVD